MDASRSFSKAGGRIIPYTSLVKNEKTEIVPLFRGLLQVLAQLS